MEPWQNFCCQACKLACLSIKINSTMELQREECSLGSDALAWLSSSNGIRGCMQIAAARSLARLRKRFVRSCGIAPVFPMDLRTDGACLMDGREEEGGIRKSHHIYSFILSYPGQARRATSEGEVAFDLILHSKLNSSRGGSARRGR